MTRDSISARLSFNFPFSLISQHATKPSPASAPNPSSPSPPTSSPSPPPSSTSTPPSTPKPPLPPSPAFSPPFKTPFNDYFVKFSPFYENRLAVATAQNFGILGNGHLHVLDLSPDPSLPISKLIAYNTADGVYDATWFEPHDSIIIAEVANGSVKLYNLALPQRQTLSDPSTNTLTRFTLPTTTLSVATPSSLLLGRHR